MKYRISLLSHPALFRTFLLVSFLFLTGCGANLQARPVSNSGTHGNLFQQKHGIHHILQRGETLSDLSIVYQVPVSTLMEVNGISNPTTIPAGSRIFIPGASRVLPVPSHKKPRLAWPLRGKITSPFGTRGRRPRHEGIDIDGVLGQLVKAAGNGRVIQAKTGRGYGLFVEIDHGQGLTTFYAHASKLLVRVGDRVNQGDPIAKVGRSGNARGTHLHFEVRRNTRPIDPLLLLRNKNTRKATLR